MRSGVVPAALLLVALGLALAIAPRRARAPSLLALVATVAIFGFLPMPRAWLGPVFLGCWVAVIATAASVQFARRLGLPAALILSVDGGLWASAVISLSGPRVDLLKIVPFALIVVPARWVVRRHGSVPVKVVSSWVIAVAVLAITLGLLPVLPGYLPDHME